MKIPVFRISLTNATMLSVLYLLVGAVVELVRRAFNPRWADRLSFSLEAFPARTLDLLGLYEPLKRAFLEEQISATSVRLIYGATTVGLIFTLGVLVGAAMWLVARVAKKPNVTLTSSGDEDGQPRS